MYFYKKNLLLLFVYKFNLLFSDELKPSNDNVVMEKNNVVMKKTPYNAVVIKNNQFFIRSYIISNDSLLVKNIWNDDLMNNKSYIISKYIIFKKNLFLSILKLLCSTINFFLILSLMRFIILISDSMFIKYGLYLFMGLMFNVLSRILDNDYLMNTDRKNDIINRNNNNLASEEETRKLDFLMFNIFFDIKTIINIRKYYFIFISIIVELIVVNENFYFFIGKHMNIKSLLLYLLLLFYFIFQIISNSLKNQLNYIQLFFINNPKIFNKILNNPKLIDSFFIINNKKKFFGYEEEFSIYYNF